MIKLFENVSESEFETLKNAISWITILIAGADDKIDKEETDWASKLTKIRAYGNPDILNEFYDEVGQDFESYLNDQISTLPSDVTQRNTILSERISMINAILPKLENNLGFHLYKSYTSFASHVAKASGGFLRFFSVSSDESKWVDLPMLNEVVQETPEEDV